MPRRIGCNKTPFLRSEIPVSHVNGNPLFTLRNQSVQQKRVVDFTPPTSYFSIKRQRLFLICKQEFCVIQHVPQESGLAVVNTSACNKFQQSVHSEIPLFLPLLHAGHTAVFVNHPAGSLRLYGAEGFFYNFIQGCCRRRNTSR